MKLDPKKRSKNIEEQKAPAGRTDRVRYFGNDPRPISLKEGRGSPFAKAAYSRANETMNQGGQKDTPFSRAVERRGKVTQYAGKKRVEGILNRLDAQIAAGEENLKRTNKTKPRPTGMDAVRELGRQADEEMSALPGKKERLKRKSK